MSLAPNARRWSRRRFLTTRLTFGFAQTFAKPQSLHQFRNQLRRRVLPVGLRFSVRQTAPFSENSGAKRSTWRRCVATCIIPITGANRRTCFSVSSRLCDRCVPSRKTFGVRCSDFNALTERPYRTTLSICRLILYRYIWYDLNVLVATCRGYRRILSDYVVHFFLQPWKSVVYRCCLIIWERLQTRIA